MDRAYNESFRLGCRDFADLFLGCEAAEGLEPPGTVAGCHEAREVRAQLAVLVTPFGDGALDGAVHPLYFAGGSRVVGFRQPVPDPVGLTDHVEAHWPERDGVPVPRRFCELGCCPSGWCLDGTPPQACAGEIPMRCALSALSTSAVTANLLVRSM